MAPGAEEQQEEGSENLDQGGEIGSEKTCHEPGSNQWLVSDSYTVFINFVFINFLHRRCETRSNDTDQMMIPQKPKAISRRPGTVLTRRLQRLQWTQGPKIGLKRQRLDVLDEVAWGFWGKHAFFSKFFGTLMIPNTCFPEFGMFATYLYIFLWLPVQTISRTMCFVFWQQLDLLLNMSCWSLTRTRQWQIKHLVACQMLKCLIQLNSLNMPLYFAGFQPISRQSLKKKETILQTNKDNFWNNCSN